MVSTPTLEPANVASSGEAPPTKAAEAEVTMAKNGVDFLRSERRYDTAQMLCRICQAQDVTKEFRQRSDMRGLLCGNGGHS